MKKPIVIELDQGTPEWLSWRKTKIGAADSAIILGQSPWTTREQLWLTKMGMYEVEETDAMKRGKELEPIVRELLMIEYGMFIKPIIYQHGEYDWMIASLDGIADDGEIFEIKCPGMNTHQWAVDGYIPNYYQTQMQHQMEVCQADRMTYVSYNPEHSQRLICLDVYRDDEYIKELVEHEKRFYNMMVNFESPKVQDQPWLFEKVG